MNEISPTIIWAILGITLIITEVFTASFFLLFFGIAALVVAAAKLMGLENFTAELILFAVLGLAGALAFRKKVLASFKSDTSVVGTDGKVIAATEDIAAKGSGKIQYQGTVWMAVNSGEADIKSGDSVTIVKTDGVKLVLTKV